MRFATTTAVLLLAGLVLATPPKVVEEFSGKVIGVTDGDTIKVLVNKESVTVRLEGIDAPESGQSCGKKSKEALAEMVAGKTVTVKKTGTDKYKRPLGIVIVDDADANAKMVEDGWVWHYSRYSKDKKFSEAEAEARIKKKGLWIDQNPVAPWDYRSNQKVKK